MTFIEQRIGTAAQWTTKNPVLRLGEVGWETSGKAKLGDGVTPWNSLAYSVQPFDPSLIAGKAPIDSPTFTGDPKAPTPVLSDNDKSVATTEFVKGQGYAVPGDITAAVSAASATDRDRANHTGSPGADWSNGNKKITTLADATALTDAMNLRATQALLTPIKRRIGPLVECVVVGSSNAVANTWPTEFCATWGLTQRNYAIAGTGFTSATNFLSQLQSAAADAAFANNDVGLVVICDASNNIRSWNNTGSTVDVGADASAAFSYARSTFPRARVVCIPVIWPSDPQTNVTGVPGGWQSSGWMLGLPAVVEQIRTAAAVNNVEVVDHSWTWLSGLSGVMNADGSVHPNAAGYTLVAQWLSKHLRGESTRKDTPWANVPYLNATGAPPLRWRRQGWDVYFNGGIQNTVAGSGGLTDVAQFPAGIRTSSGAEFTARPNGSTTAFGLQMYANGTLRIWTALSANSLLYTAGQFTLFG